jgi:hypothetical protein
MQHLNRRPKRCVEAQDSRSKESQGNSEEIQEEGSHVALWWRTGQSAQRDPQPETLERCSTGLSGVH